MYVANTHLKPVLGIDIHFVNMPFPFVPIPHPYIGLVFDPFDYIPFIGATVKVNGVPRGNTDTMGMIITFVHIPFGAGFTLYPIIGHNSQNFFGSKKVMVDGAPMSGAGYILMTCNDIGIPLSFRPGRKFIPIPSLYLPTSFCIPLQWGKPVNVGGPLVPHFSLMALLKAFVFGCFLKVLGKIASAVFKKLSGKLAVRMRASAKLQSLKCKLGFEPVDLISGRVTYEYTDFELPGPIPLRWTRVWDSDAGLEGWLGHGVHCCYDRYIRAFEEDGAMALLLADGRVAAFPLLLPGQEFYHRSEKLSVRRKNNGNFLVEDFSESLYLHFNHAVTRDTWRLSFIEDYSGHRIQFHYVGDRVQAISDSAGRMLQLQTDAARRITRVVVKAGDVLQTLVSYHYGEEGDLVAIDDALGQSVLLEYDDHLLVQKTDRNGHRFHWEYDRLRRCVHTYGEGGVQEGWIEYADGYNLVTNSLGENRTYWYDEDRQCTQEADHYGNSRQTEYTDAGEIYRQTDEEGLVTGYVYDEEGRLKEQIQPDGSIKAFYYNTKHQPTLIVYPNGQSISYGYDRDSRLRHVNYPDGHTVSYEYNDKGQVEKVVEDTRPPMLLEYDAMENLVGLREPDGARMQWKYDALGRCIQATDAEGRIRHYGYDALGRLQKLWLPDGNILLLEYDAYEDITRATDRNGEAEFEYTEMGSLKRKKQDGQEIRFFYDTAERLRNIVNEAGNYYRLSYNARGEVTGETGFDGRQREYLRNTAGKIVRINRPGDRSTAYEYDAAGRVIRIDYDDGGREVFRYDKNGYMTEASNEHAVVKFERNKVGGVSTEWQGAQSVMHTHDKFGRRTSYTSSLGATVRIDRDDMGRPAAITAKSPTAYWEGRFRYNEDGQEVERLLPGGVKSEWDYDAAGRPGEHRVSTGARIRSWKKYAWTAGNRLTRILDALAKSDIRFRDDAMGNLVWAQYAEKVVYRTADATGNIYERTDKKDRRYSAAGALLESPDQLCSYDEEGNLVSRVEKGSGTSWQYRWQSNGLLAAVVRPDGKEVVFQYDALGRRNEKTFDGVTTRYLWDGNTLLHEWRYREKDRPQVTVDEWGGLSTDRDEPVEGVVSWVFDADRYVPAARMEGDQISSIISDHLGTPQEGYNEKGEKIWDLALDIYGRVRTLTGDAQAVPFRYQGQYEDAETGLYYNGFRYYFPEGGVYISQDPTGIAGGFNVYAYVHNPNGWVDVFGLAGVPDLLVSENLKTLDLTDPSWRTTVFSGDQKGIVYILKDSDSGELLKVGKTEVENFDSRFRTYAKAGRLTDRNLSVDCLTIDRVDEYKPEAVEKQARAALEKMGHKLPWDNTENRLGRPGPGVPFVRPGKSARVTHKWDKEGNFIKKPCK